MKAVLLVFLGGGAGSVLRFLIGRSMNAASPAFPWGTFTVNLVGSLIIGLAFGWVLEKGKLSDDTLFLIVAGFCGGFTTFSAFAHESLNLLREGYSGLFFSYVVSSIVLGLACVWLGYAVIRAI